MCLAADIVAVGLGDRADGDLPHLRASAHDDDPLAVDLLQVLDDLDGTDDGQAAKILHELLRAGRKHHLEIRASRVGPVVQDLDGRDVAVVARNHSGQLVQDSGAAHGVNDQPNRLLFHLGSFQFSPNNRSRRSTERVWHRLSSMGNLGPIPGHLPFSLPCRPRVSFISPQLPSEDLECLPPDVIDGGGSISCLMDCRTCTYQLASAGVYLCSHTFSIGPQSALC